MYRPDTNELSFSFLIFSSTSRRVHEIFPGVQLPPAGKRCIKAGALYLTKNKKKYQGSKFSEQFSHVSLTKNSCENIAVGEYGAQVQRFT